MENVCVNWQILYRAVEAFVSKLNDKMSLSKPTFGVSIFVESLGAHRHASSAIAVETEPVSVIFGETIERKFRRTSGTPFMPFCTWDRFHNSIVYY